jgi:hypothetical protein
MSHWEFLHPEDYEDEDFTTDIFSNPHVTDDDIDGAAGTECIFCYRRRDDIIIRHDGIKACVDCLEYLKTSSRDRWKLSKRTLSPRQSRMGLKPVTRGETANDEWNLLIQNRPPPPEISDLFASAPLSAIFQSLRTREIRTFEPAFYRFPSTDDNYENRRRQLAEVKIPLRYRRSLI